MVQKARAASVPKDTIQKAIRRGTGEEQGTSYEAISYEGYAPGGVAVLVAVLTDNRNRTGAEIRAVFSKMGGSMAEPGAVAWQFSRKGQLSVPRSANEEDLMLVALEAGAEDVRDDLDAWTVTTEPNDLEPVQSAIEAAGLIVTSAEVTMVASTSVPVTDAEDARKVLRILDAFEDNDDVQDVYSNADLDDEVLTGIEA
jgi:YebC/PmpR family DNA-binding regulatory protein